MRVSLNHRTAWKVSPAECAASFDPARARAVSVTASPDRVNSTISTRSKARPLAAYCAPIPAGLSVRAVAAVDPRQQHPRGRRGRNRAVIVGQGQTSLPSRITLPVSSGGERSVTMKCRVSTSTSAPASR